MIRIYPTNYKVILCMALFLNIGCSVFGIRTVEEVKYQVRFKDGDKEIREYPPRIVAQTTVGGDYKEAQTKAFRILADYIFGKNEGKQDISMTAPVSQEPKSVEIAMTAPVTQTESEGGWTMTFAMPSKFQTVSEVPKPLDKRIMITQKPSGLFAAIRFTWLTNQNKNNIKSEELLRWLDGIKKYQPISLPSYTGYDPPWTIPFLRRQEMIIEVSQKNL